MIRRIIIIITIFIPMATTIKITTRSNEVENNIGTINNETLTIYIKGMTVKEIKSKIQAWKELFNIAKYSDIFFTFSLSGDFIDHNTNYFGEKDERVNLDSAYNIKNVKLNRKYINADYGMFCADEGESWNQSKMVNFHGKLSPSRGEWSNSKLTVNFE